MVLLPGLNSWPQLATVVLSIASTNLIEASRQVAPGIAYSLCWCNGTESSCSTEGDFRVHLGALHMEPWQREVATTAKAGPSADQQSANSTCRAGLPCEVRLEGHALEPGSRLVVLPRDPRGCLWRRASRADPMGLVDFPNLGVSAPCFRQLRNLFLSFSGAFRQACSTVQILWGPLDHRGRGLHHVLVRSSGADLGYRTGAELSHPQRESSTRVPGQSSR